MTITISLDHADIVGTNNEEFQAMFGMLQAYAKMTIAVCLNSDIKSAIIVGKEV